MEKQIFFSVMSIIYSYLAQQTSCLPKFLQSIYIMRDQYIFEIWTAFWNLHVTFEHHQQDFRVPVEISLAIWWYKAMNFSSHCGILK